MMSFTSPTANCCAANGLLLSVVSYSCVDQLTVGGLFVNFNIHNYPFNQ